MMSRIRGIIASVGILVGCWAQLAWAQAPLVDVGVFANVVGLNTVPDHGDKAVSFLDYRDGGYSIVVVDFPTAYEHEIARVFYAEPVVSTFGERVTWIGYTPLSQPDVYLHDRSSGSTSRVTDDAAFQNHPDLGADVLVWQDYRNAGSDQMNADIYMRDLTSGQTSPVTTDPGYQDLPRTHGSWIVWQDYRHSDSLTTADIYAFDLINRESRRLTTGKFYRTHPAIWNTLVVWEDYRNGENGDIYLYDLASDQEMAITTHAAHQEYPAVYGDWILWLDYRHSNEQGDLFGYHLPTGTEHELVIDQAHQEAPHIYGDHVVWQDYRDERFDVFGGTLIDPEISDIEEGSSHPTVEFTAAPNPFVDDVTFTTIISPTDPLELTIFDALGRTIVRRQISPFEVRVVWNGRSDGGWDAPAGVYIAVLSGDDTRHHTLIVRQ